MSYYLFECPDHHVWDFDRKDDEPLPEACPYCGQKALRSRMTASRPKTYGEPSRLIVGTFKPYVEENAGPRPLYFPNKESRDTFLRRNQHLTYDKKSDIRKPSGAAVDSVTLDDVKQAVKENARTGRTED